MNRHAMVIRVIGVLMLGAAAPTAGGFAQEPIRGDRLISRVDSLAAATLAEGLVAGLSVAVRRDGEILLARGYGYADLENSVPATVETIYGIGSVTKQFTAAAILQLAERGVLSLDDSVHRFLPDYEPTGRSVTIRQLLSHTSGIPSYPSEETPARELAVDLTDRELRERFESLPLDFTSGEGFRYSNSAYLLLGMVVSEASGVSYADYIQEYLFAPLGLSRSSYCDTRRITPRRARGYWIENGELVNAPYLSMTHAGAAGAICSTILDLLSWSAALRAGRVISAARYEEMVTPAVLADGRELPYGLGLRIEARMEGIPNISHGGGIHGYQTQLDYFPGSDLEVVVISNTNGLHVRRFADFVARWSLGIPAPVIADESRSADELRTYSGVYLVRDREWRVAVSKGFLYLHVAGQDRTRLKAQPDGSFVPANNEYTRITFLVAEDSATSLRVDQCVPTDHTRCRTLDGTQVP